MRALLVGALATGAVMASVATAAAAPQLTGAQQIAFLNAQRAANGIPAGITEVPAWSDGCQKHMAWLETNNVFLAHDEVDGSPGWTQEGDDAGNSSVLVKPGDAFSTSGVNAFETAPIHLGQMLSPFILQSGAWGGCLNTIAGRTRTFATPQTFSYPGDGRTGVPTSEVSFESPFVPAAAVGLGAPNDPERSVVTGPNLYFYYASPRIPGPWFSTGQITSATLTGPSGPVEVRFVDNTTPAPAGKEAYGSLGSFLAGGGILIPVAPLKGGSTYTASVTFQPNNSGEPAISRTWSFSTSGTAPSGGGGSGSTGGAGGSGATGGSGGAGGSPSSGLPKVSKVKLKSRSVAFESSAASELWVTVEKRLPRKGMKTRWSSKRSFAAPAVVGANRFTMDKLPKATYRVRVRGGVATGKIAFERTLTLR